MTERVVIGLGEGGVKVMAPEVRWSQSHEKEVRECSVKTFNGQVMSWLAS